MIIIITIMATIIILKERKREREIKPHRNYTKSNRQHLLADTQPVPEHQSDFFV